jgi:hypothetical protein
MRLALRALAMMAMRVAGGHSMTSHLSLARFSMAAMVRAWPSDALVPFIFQLPATSGRGPRGRVMLALPTPFLIWVLRSGSPWRCTDALFLA